MANYPIFIDTDVSEQTSELKAYLKAAGGEISEENSDNSAKELLKIVEVTDIIWKENDNDIETLFNGLVSLMLLIPDDQNEELILRFCEKVSKPPTGDKKSLCRFKALSNLFYGTDEKSPYRYHIYCSLMRLALQTDLLHLLNIELKQVKKWLSQWNVPIQKSQNLLRMIHDAMVETKIGDATKVMIELLGTYTEDNASQARDDAHRCIVTCLGDPNTFLMDHLLTLKPVRFLEGELIHDLLTIFVSGKLVQYHQFYKNNTDFVKSIGLSHEMNVRKMRVLTFMQLSENCSEIDFSTLEEEMDLRPEEVEEFFIEVLCTKAVRAKIDQMQRKVLVHSTIYRTFGKQHWQLLRQNLSHWKNSLSQVQDSLGSVDIMAATQ